jgi:hypothetical protein
MEKLQVENAVVSQGSSPNWQFGKHTETAIEPGLAGLGEEESCESILLGISQKN